MKEKVLLGMSGGVDSSASAALLIEKGYEVIGCTMKLWQPCNKEEDKESINKGIRDAKKVCDNLNIPHYTIDCEEEFKKKVVKKFIEEYKEGRTPNPCVECNKYLKFGIFFEKAQELGCQYIATGHYACVEFSNKYQQYVLKKSKEANKDQTYFLYSIEKEKLKNIIFPLQDCINKEDTRRIAQKNELVVAQKKDSQEICFIPNNDYKSFINKHEKCHNKKGYIVLKNGKILGKHQGIINYTIGQRKGLGISYSEPLYVLKVDKEKNEVVVGIEKELYSKELYAKEVNWMVWDNLKKPIKCKAKIRYRAKEAEVMVYPDENKVKVIFKEEQRAITSGQSVVFYDEEGIVLGGGKIE